MWWEQVKFVSTGLTLVAFLACVAASVYKWRSQQRERLIKTAPEAERAKLIDLVLRDFHVDTSALTKRQKYEIAILQINIRVRRFKIAAVLVCFLAVIFGGLALLAIYKSSSSGSSPEQVVQDFYDWYYKKAVQGNDSELPSSKFLATSDSVDPYFIENLSRLEVMYGEGEEDGGLGYDPVFMAQDFPLGFNVLSGERNGNDSTVFVTWGADSGEPYIKVSLKRIGEKWKIHSIATVKDDCC